jgi:hypothetical protein
MQEIKKNPAQIAVFLKKVSAFVNEDTFLKTKTTQ